METHKLESHVLLNSIKAGAQRVINARTLLNDINVFPVADSDTGNNMASLMRSIIEVSIETTESVKDVLSKVAEKSLEGAKGNSGMIFAQFLNGISKTYAQRDDLIHAIQEAVVDAYSAVQNPQEGTMLSVMTAWAIALNDSSRDISDSTRLRYAREEARSSVQKTQEHKVMKRYNVVDAGAKGFYEFVDGMTDAFLGIGTPMIVVEKHDSVSHTDHRYEGIPTSRYCLEVTLKTNAYTPIQKDDFVNLGDSLVVVEGANVSKIHIHTDSVPEVLGVLSSYGTVQKIKADDMKQQYFDNHQNQRDIAIVTDSIADIPQEIIKKYNVHVLPLTVLIDETEHLDKVSIRNDILLNMIEGGTHEITTSLANSGLILRMFESLEATYSSVLVITVASVLSGTHQAIQNAIKMYSGSLTFHVVDSKLNSMAQGILVEVAGKAVDNGMDFTRLINHVEKEKESIHIYVSVSDLGAMVRSGRIPQFLGNVFQRLGLKPIVTLDSEGNGTLSTIGFTRLQNKKNIWKKINRRKEDIEMMYLGYTSDSATAIQWRADYIKHGLKDMPVVETSSIIALSAGRDATAVAVKYRRNDV